MKKAKLLAAKKGILFFERVSLVMMEKESLKSQKKIILILL